MPEINFDAAENFIKAARVAHEAGNDARCTAAIKLVAVALHLSDSPPVKPKPEPAKKR